MLDVMLLWLFAQTPAPPLSPVADVRRLEVSAPQALAEIDTTKVQGDPIGLAWNADGVIYLRVTQSKDRTRHYQIATRPTLSVAQSDGAPVWAADYWNWKSAVTAPDDPTLRIDIEQRRDKVRSTNTPGAGDIAGTASAAMGGGSGGEGASQAVAMSAALTSTMSNVVTLRLKGQVVGEWVNETPQLGMRLGWAPAPMGLLAYVDAEGRLAIVDREGHKQTVPGSLAALLPAWSMDGQQILFLQKKSAKLYTLMAARVQ